MMSAWKALKEISRLGLTSIALLLVSCFGDPQIEGVVNDQSGNPVADVTVSIKGSSFQSSTGPDGTYQLRFVPGKIDVVYSKEGYLQDRLSLDLTSNRDYQAEPALLYRMPEDGKALVFGSDLLEPLEPAELTRHTQDNGLEGIARMMGAAQTNGYYAQGELAAFPAINEMGIVEPTGNRMALYVVDSTGLFYSHDSASLSAISGKHQYRQIEIHQDRFNDHFSIIQLPKALSPGIYLLTSTQGQGEAQFSRMMGGVGFGNPGFLFSVSNEGGSAVNREAFYPLRGAMQNLFNSTLSNGREQRRSGEWKDALTNYQVALATLPRLQSSAPIGEAELKEEIESAFTESCNALVMSKQWDELVAFAEFAEQFEEFKDVCKPLEKAAQAEHLENEHKKRYSGSTSFRPDPWVGEAWLERGNLYLAAGMYEDALNAWGKGADYDKHDEQALLRIGWKALKIEAPPEALKKRIGEEAERWAKMIAEETNDWAPFSTHLLELSAAVSAYRGETDRAINYHRRAASAFSFEAWDVRKMEKDARTIANESYDFFLDRESALMAGDMAGIAPVRIEKSPPEAEKSSELLPETLPISREELIGGWRVGESSVAYYADGTFAEIDRRGDLIEGKWSMPSDTDLKLTVERKYGKPTTPHSNEFEIMRLQDGLMLWHYPADDIHGISVNVAHLFPAITFGQSHLVGTWGTTMVLSESEPPYEITISLAEDGTGRLSSFQYKGFDETIRWKLIGDTLVWVRDYNGDIKEHRLLATDQVGMAFWDIGYGRRYSFVRR